jgi:hypothetical protein
VACVHHPDAAYKRISFGTVTYQDGSYWCVNWNEGVTEQGSSGSGLFLVSNHRFVAQLSYGWSSCSNPNEPDCYGKFSTSYNDGLSTWLGSATTLGGLYYGGSDLIFLDGFESGDTLAWSETLP